MSDPVRWRDGAPDAPPGARALLDAARPAPRLDPVVRAQAASHLAHVAVSGASGLLRVFGAKALAAAGTVGLAGALVVASVARGPARRRAHGRPRPPPASRRRNLRSVRRRPRPSR